MDRTPVTSSSIASIGYDPNTSMLEIEFRHGAVYRYFDVPETIHHELISADSIGRYLNQNIRNVFRYERT